MKIAILGYGTVGSGVYDIITNGKTEELNKIEVKSVFARSRDKMHLATDDINEILNDEEIQITPSEIDSVLDRLNKDSEIFVYSDKPEESKEVCKKLGLDGYTVINLIEPFNTTKYRNAFYNKNDYIETQADLEASPCG